MELGVWGNWEERGNGIGDNSVAMVSTSRQRTSETLKKGRPVGSGLPWKIDVLEFFFHPFFFFSVLFLHTSTQAGTRLNGQQLQQHWTGEMQQLFSSSCPAALQLLTVWTGRRERDGPSPEKTESTQCQLSLTLPQPLIGPFFGPGRPWSRDLSRFALPLCNVAYTFSRTCSHLETTSLGNSLLILFLFPIQKGEKI